MGQSSTDTSPSIKWPDGRAFAFTIFDDTDWTTLDNGPVVYDFLTELGFRVTKSVWPLATRAPRTTGGGTCSEDDYLDWVLHLQEVGHEIGYHNATDHSSFRSETIEALETFRKLFGHFPRVGADHAGNNEALYGGSERLSGLFSRLYEAAARALQPSRPHFSGSDPESAYFWGDLCRAHITYWRNFTFTETNTLRSCPLMPYNDPARPFVNYFFAATHGPRLEPFLQRLGAEQLDSLEQEGGACIMYTHFGVDFVNNGILNPLFVEAMTSLSKRNGWFAPVSDVLDVIRDQRPSNSLTTRSRHQLERRWVLDRIRNSKRFGPVVSTTTSR